MAKFRKIGKFVASALALVATGCGQVPMGSVALPYDPSQPRNMAQTPVPVLPAGVTAVSVVLEPGTATLRVGESFRFQAVITGSDGKRYAHPRLVQFSLSNPQGGRMDLDGVLIPELPGTLKVTARAGNVTAEATVQVEAARFAWSQMISPATTNLRAVKMVSRTEAWAAGDGGTLLRYLNGAWQRDVNFRELNNDLKGIAFANSNLGWVVGERRGGGVPFMARWNGATWTAERLPSAIQGSINAISVLSERDAWAVGNTSGGDPLIVHWDGASWKEFASPGGGKLNDVQMLSSRSGWAVGKGSGLQPMILRYKDGVWTKASFWNNRGTTDVLASLELKSIQMVSETQGYAVGTRDYPMLDPRGLFLEFDPQRNGFVSGRYDSATDNLDQVPLNDLAMISGTEGWALGQARRPDFQFERNPQSVFGNLLQNNNGTLKPDTGYFSGNLSGAFLSIDLLPQGEGFVVGEGGLILQRTFDWRGVNANNAGYGGGAYGTGGQSNTGGITYGPGGAQVPGTNPTPYY